jgi:hypothetical protein
VNANGNLASHTQGTAGMPPFMRHTLNDSILDELKLREARPPMDSPLLDAFR